MIKNDFHVDKTKDEIKVYEKKPKIANNEIENPEQPRFERTLEGHAR